MEKTITINVNEVNISELVEGDIILMVNGSDTWLGIVEKKEDGDILITDKDSWEISLHDAVAMEARLYKHN